MPKKFLADSTCGNRLKEKQSRQAICKQYGNDATGSKNSHSLNTHQRLRKNVSRYQCKVRVGSRLAAVTGCDLGQDLGAFRKRTGRPGVIRLALVLRIPLPPPQGCSTLWNRHIFKQVIDACQSSAVAVLAGCAGVV